MTKKLTTALFAAALLAFMPRISVAEEHTPLEDQMSAMNKAFKTLKKQVDDASKKDASLELIATMKKSAAASKDLVPAKAKDIPEKDRAKFVDDYKAAIDQLIAEFDTLEKAVRDGKTDDAKAAIEKITKEKGDGHKKFQKDEDK